MQQVKGEAIERFPAHHQSAHSHAYPVASIPYVSRKRVYEIVKRILDLLFASMGLILLAPFLLGVALVIWLDDPHGSPLYVSTRCGKNGKPFYFYKFRSMCVHADTQLDQVLDLNEADGPVFKIKNDPRVTRVGRIIRKYSIDELPQLINVIRGDMGIVGPRPPLPREVAQYSPEHIRRLQVKPGLTCYWQIQPNRNDIAFEQWMRMDMEYIKNRSLMLDARLIFRTIKTLLLGDGV